jgi:hypothetical protein
MFYVGLLCLFNIKGKEHFCSFTIDVLCNYFGDVNL